MSATENFDYEMTDVEFRDKHKGHEKEVEDDFNKTVSIFSMGASLPREGEGKCPACNVVADVLITDKICHHHDYGEHIDITCTECGAVGHTKNIKSIGKRSIYQECSCTEGWFFHECSVDGEKRT